VTATSCLPAPLRLPLAVASVLGAVLVAALGGTYAAGADLGPVDAWGGPRSGLSGGQRTLALIVDFSGEPLGAALLVAALAAGCLALRRPRAAVLAVAGPAVATTAAAVLKIVVGRTVHGEFLSFPSGHTALLTAVALVVGLLVAGLRQLGAAAGTALVLLAAGAAGAAAGWAQVALGAHYLTDTIGGFCTAVAVVPAMAFLIDQVLAQRSPR
jgi:membrane-associated phospholipid phosphatase